MPSDVPVHMHRASHILEVLPCSPQERNKRGNKAKQKHHVFNNMEATQYHTADDLEKIDVQIRPARPPLSETEYTGRKSKTCHRTQNPKVEGKRCKLRINQNQKGMYSP